MAQQRLTMLYLGKDGKLHSWTGIIVSPPPPIPPAVGAPMARIQKTASSGLSFTFSGTTSTEGTAGVTITKYAWDFGDGATGSGPTITHVYARGGTYTVRLTITDSLSVSNSTSLSVAVTQPNIPPTTSLVGQAISADGLTWQYTITPADSDGTVTRVVVGYGDGGSNDSSLATDPGGIKTVYTHTYARGGTYTAGTTAYDNAGGVTTVYTTVTVTQVTPPQPPVAKLVLTQSNMSTTYSAAGSSTATGAMLNYAVVWGDGTSTGGGAPVTGSHTYAATGPWLVTLIVTDTSTGLYSQATAYATPTQAPVGMGVSVKSPWAAGSPTEDFPSSVPVIKARTLQPSGTLNLAAMVAAMTSDAVIDISGQQVVISSFNGGNLSAVNGGSHFLGLLGGISGGVFDNQVTVQPNIFPASVVSAIQANQSGTSQYAMIRTAAAISGGKPVYFMGVHLVGADQGHVTDGGSAQITNGPARYKGIDMDLAAPGLFQNCFLEAMNYSDGSTPPWEVGAVDSRRNHGFLVRRVEMSGALPVGSPSRPSSSTVDPFGLNWLRSGGFQWNADTGPVMQDFSLHDGLVSGLTFSIASSSNNSPGPVGNNSGNITLTNLYVENQSQHGFSGVNLESCLGYIHIDHPTIKMNGSGGHHIGFNARLGIAAPVIPSSSFVITEPVWSGGPAGAMFSVRIAGQAQWAAPPTVIKNGIQLIPTTATGLDPAKYYHVLQLT